MKTRRILALALAVLTFVGITSCTKTEKMIIGSWEVTTAELIDPEEGETLEMDGTVWTFSADNTVSVRDETTVSYGTYSIDDETLVLTMSEDTEYGTLSAVMTFDITEISKTKMNVEGTMSVAIAGRDLGDTDLKISFKKI